MNRKIIWKYAGLFFISLLIINPELAEFAIFIDALGLEIFILLIEIQILSFGARLYQLTVKPFFKFLYLSISSIFQRIPIQRLDYGPLSVRLFIPDSASLMHLLVFCVMLDHLGSVAQEV